MLFSNSTYSKLSNAIRSLTIDAIERSQSGHPGMPLGMADVVTVLFSDFLKFSPQNPNWNNRDRFILSAGHGSMLLYSLLYLTGYDDIDTDQIQNFRQLHSKTSGHPENFLVKGVETTTGPLGQGLANAVGMAIAERYHNARNPKLLHKTYVIAGDGCLMEGISHEAASLAGHLKLKNLIVLYDSNDITIDGKTSLALSDDTKQRFQSYGWNYIKINGHNYEEIHSALTEAQSSLRPTLIECKTKIGFGSPNKEGSEKSHGAPLGSEEAELTKKTLGITNQPFQIENDVLDIWRNKIGKKLGDVVDIQFEHKNKNLDELFSKLKQDICEKKIKEATRISSKNVIEAVLNLNDNIIGGTADLGGSNGVLTSKTKIINSDDYNGNFLHYGVREHAMAAISNGLALYGGVTVFNSTFLAFYDYMKPAVRLSAIMSLPVIYIFTHDSIGLGEDGPTHQPIEQLASLRSTPNLICFRPANALETAECWEIALNSKNPVALCLTRQSVEPSIRTDVKENMCKKGAYVIAESKKQNADVTIFASGSELEIAIKSREELKKSNITSRVVSVPSFELFDLQPEEYKNNILYNSSLNVAIEAASEFGWHKFIGRDGLFVGMNSFGLSAPADDLYEHFDITVDHLVKQIKTKLGRNYAN